VPVYDFSTGGCHDVIDPQGINENMGAESTLSWLISLLSMYKMMGEKVLVENGTEGSRRMDIETTRADAETTGANCGKRP